jgi:putative spermidine/putrescine transport system ATP-binding protein
VTAPFLDIRQATKSFGSAVVLDGVDLGVARGEFVSLLGPSGCGKTTLLRIISGLLRTDRGDVFLDGEEIGDRPPHRRDVGVVFQNYALFPHLTVAENVAFGLKAKAFPASEIAGTVSRYLSLVRMSEFSDRSVRALSGGQQQRVAVARALAVKPKLLLLDEPFSALDRKLRETMQIELKRLLRELGTTAVFVTHDQDEALVMSDRIAVMHRGRIEQYAEPQAIYDHPATAFALAFVGLSSRIAGTVAAEEGPDHVRVHTPLGSLTGHGRFVAGSAVVVGMRPERLRLCGAGDGASAASGAIGGENAIEARVRDVVFQGARVQIHCDAPDDQPLLVDCPAGGAYPSPGDMARIRWSVANTLVLAQEGHAPQAPAADGAAS